mgnify:FL=1
MTSTVNIFTRDLNDPMDEVQQKIKDKMIEVTNLELTDKTSYHAYEEVYPFLLDKFIGKKCNMLEVGMSWGGGMQILSELFPESIIYGLDWNVGALKIDVDDFSNMKVFECSQTDPDLPNRVPMLDFVTEDCSHQMPNSIRTFELLEPKLNPGGVYVIEDVYPEFYDDYCADGRFDIYDVRDIKNRVDDVVAVYRKPE